MTSVDGILREPYQALHDRFYPIPARVLDPGGFGGQLAGMTQFGLQFQSTSEWIISRRIFKTKKIPGREVRPFEGDLLLVGNYQGTKDNPIWTNSLFEMTLVQRDFPNWPLGQHYIWQISCQLYHHSHEKFDTKNPHIDRINTERSNEEELNLGVNKALEQSIDGLVDFDEINPFGNV
jgi:hypothetical protein